MAVQISIDVLHYNALHCNAFIVSRLDNFKSKFRLRLPLNRYRRILGTIMMQRMTDTTWFYQTIVLPILTSSF